MICLVGFESLFMDEEIFTELRGAQELGHVSVLDCTSERHNLQRDKTGGKKIQVQLGHSVVFRSKRSL